MPRALILDSRESENSAQRANGPREGVRTAVREIDVSRLPEGDVLVDVLFSSLNYKDALAVTGEGKIIRGDLPFVPGIDLVGRVRGSETDRFAAGDLVIGTGWGLGESRWGGYAQVQRVNGSALVPLPDGLSPEASMVAGTAGLTAMLAVMELESRGVAPGNRPVLVTGASGGVGSFAVALLSGYGFDVTASTGSAEAHDYLRELGADEIVDRDVLGRGAERPLDSARWVGAVDVVGSRTLEAVLSRIARHGAVAACGLAGGPELHTTIYPFILRGVSLIGVDSNTCPPDVRRRAWQRLADRMTDEMIRRIETSVIRLDEIPEYSRRLLSGGVRGRVVVDVNA